MDLTKFNVKAWVGQSTTGQGATVLMGTLLAVSQGQLTLTAAVPVLVMGVVLVIWPQNTPLAAAAQGVATDLEKLFVAYRAGLQHGSDASRTVVVAGPPAPSGVAQVPAPGAPPAAPMAGPASYVGSPPVSGAAAAMLAIGLMVSLAACSAPQQGQAIAGASAAYSAVASLEEQTIKSGVLTPSQVLELKDLDKRAYNLLATLEALHRSGTDPTSADVAAALAAVQAVTDYINAHKK